MEGIDNTFIIFILNLIEKYLKTYSKINSRIHNTKSIISKSKNV